MDIFRAYIGEMNLTGHDEMGAMLPNGELAVHAHNIYLQVAYDHGLVVGVVFLLVGAASFVQGCIFYKKRKGNIPCAACRRRPLRRLLWPGWWNGYSIFAIRQDLS